MGALIELDQVTKDFPVGSGVYSALRGVSLRIDRGEFVAITGPSGHGKSTLMSLVGGLDRPTTGRFLLDGVDLSTVNDDAVAHVRSRTIGFVFQSFNLVPTLNALENVELPMIYARVPTSKRRARARELLAWAGLADHERHRPIQLSGGEQQRVAICRALALDPPLILGDEPTGNLDSRSSAVVMQQLHDLNRDGHTLVLVTHDAQVAAAARREVHIFDGRVEWDRAVVAAGGEGGHPLA